MYSTYSMYSSSRRARAAVSANAGRLSKRGPSDSYSETWDGEKGQIKDGGKFLVEEKQFAEERVNKAIERLNKCKGKNSQARLENFFGASFTKSSSMKKPEPAKGKGKNKMGAKGAGPAAKKLKK